VNVKAGDLAILIKSAANNEGKVCKVIRFVGNYIFKEGDSCNDTWIVEFPRPVAAMDGSVYLDGYISDAWLRPISGLPIEEDTNIEDRVPA
jgi:hypothetical protein